MPRPRDMARTTVADTTLPHMPTRPRCLPLILIVLAMSWPAGALAQPAPLAGFDAQVAQAVRDWKTPGLAIAVVKDGAVVFAKGYGVRRLGAPEPVDEHTRFAIGSTTKAMTAAAIGMLVDEGKLALGRPGDQAPAVVRRSMIPYVTREVRIRDLLTHRAGVPNTDLLWYEQPTPAREIIASCATCRSRARCASHFTYQNVMYAAAGEVVAAVERHAVERVRARRASSGRSV